MLGVSICLFILILTIIALSRSARDVLSRFFTRTPALEGKILLERYPHYTRSLLFSWLGTGILNPIRDQEEANCCWAIVGLASVEAAFNVILRPYHPLRLSLQEIIDCYKERYPEYKGLKEDSRGCFDHKISGAYQYVQDFGVCTEREYPFVGRKKACKACKIKTTRTRIQGYTCLVDRLVLDEIIMEQPIAAGLNVHEMDKCQIADLKEGIFKPTIGVKRKEDKSDCWFKHGVLIIGYGEEEGIEYFLVQGSWGNNWGVKGYGKIARSACDNFRRPNL